jgi:hypothetical protein
MEIPQYIVRLTNINKLRPNTSNTIGIFQNDFVASQAIERLLNYDNFLERDDFDIEEIYPEQVYWQGVEMGHWEERWTHNRPDTPALVETDMEIDSDQDDEIPELVSCSESELEEEYGLATDVLEANIEVPEEEQLDTL